MEILESKLIDYYSALGYTVLTEVPKELAFKPNLLLGKDDSISAFYYKSSGEALRESIVQRISKAKRIPKKELDLNMAFDAKPKPNDLKICNLYRLGVYYLENDAISQYAIPKKIKGKKAGAQLPKTGIFFSSKQDLEERKLAKEHIDFERDSHQIPVFAKLVEDDQRYNNSIADLTYIINDVMDNSQYVLCILTEQYREIVDKEIRRAFEYFDVEEILMYVKNTKDTKDAWKDLFDYMHFADIKVKYTEYLDSSDFKIKFNRRLMLVLQELHKKHGVDFLAG